MYTITTKYAEDKTLLEGILAADSGIITKVYDQTLPSVIQWVRDNNGQEADARDLFQDAILALYRRLENGDFELTCQVKSYLRVMCRNLWMTRLRDNRPVTELKDLEPDIRMEVSVVDRLEQSERNKLFLRHFDRLEEGCRKILALFFDRVPLRQIAENMGTTEAYVKKRKFVCKERLVEAVQADPKYGELAD